MPFPGDSDDAALEALQHKRCNHVAQLQLGKNYQDISPMDRYCDEMAQIYTEGAWK
jgi:hypothetical protein